MVERKERTQDENRRDNMASETSFKGGSEVAVVAYLVSTVQTDPLAVEKFFAAFPQVTTPYELWKPLEAKYATGDNNEKQRVLEVLKIWLEKEFKRDFLDQKRKSPVFKALCDFLKSSAVNAETSNKYKLLMIRGAATVRKLTPEIVTASTSLSQLPAATVAIPTLPPAGTKLFPPFGPPGALAGPSGGNSNDKIDFNELDAEELAKHLTMTEFDIFRTIKSSEFHHLNWKQADPAIRSRVAPNIIKMVDRFNSVSYWVATEIVMQTDIRQRVNAFKKFVAVTEHLRAMGNFNGLMEIIAGLNMFSVQRLKKTLEAIPSRCTAVLAEMDTLMENKYNYGAYRSQLNTLLERGEPCVPYLGICLRDLLMIDEGNPDRLPDKGLNFEKLQLIGDVIVQVKTFQQNPYPYKENALYTNFLKKLLILPEEMLYKQSLVCEPVTR